MNRLPHLAVAALVVCLQNDWACPASRRRPWLRSAYSTYAPGTPSSAGLARNAAAVACHTINSQTDHLLRSAYSTYAPGAPSPASPAGDSTTGPVAADYACVA